MILVHPTERCRRRTILQVPEADDVSTAQAAYDATADIYAQLVGTELSASTEGPVDRAVLEAFVELVAGHPAGLVADAGCGPGRVAAFLVSRGVEAVGVDISREMLSVAQRAHPDLHLAQGRLSALPLSDHSLAGAVCWYSIIHTSPADLDAVCTELARVLDADGHLLVAFQAGDGDSVHRAEAYGARVSLTSYRHSPDEVIRCLMAAGLHLHARAVREPALAHEATPQAFILARAGAAGAQGRLIPLDASEAPVRGP